jgi:hypothetical protein
MIQLPKAKAWYPGDKTVCLICETYDFRCDEGTEEAYILHRLHHAFPLVLVSVGYSHRFWVLS